MDATFRPYVVAGFFLVILIALPFRIKSQATHEKLDRTQEGVAMMIGLRLAGLVLWAGAIAFMIDPASMAWSSLPLPAWGRWAGVAMTLVTIPALIWTLRSLGPNLTDTVVTRQAHTLTTHGPFRWVRHPFYDCMALFTIAIWADGGQLVHAGRGSCGVRAAGGAIANRGAEVLERFGESYRAYRSVTGRFIPRNRARRLGDRSDGQRRKRQSVERGRPAFTGRDELRLG